MMTRTPMPPILYLVVRDYGPLGIGSPDATPSRDEAYDMFAQSAEDSTPVAVWQIATYGGLPISITDATDEFERELQEVCIARDLDWPEVVRFEFNPARLAAE